MLQFVLAIIAGALTVGAPCILPLLPILLATTVGRSGRYRPLFIIVGFIFAFAVVAVSLSYIVSSLMIAPNLLRRIAVAGLLIFGLFMVFPTLFEKLTTGLGKFVNKASSTSQKAGAGNFGAFMLGLLLGVIWTPCAGPVLGTILTLIATATDFGRATVLLVAYAIGAGLPMLAIAYGSQYLTTKVQAIARHARLIQRIFGALVIILAMAMYFGYDLVLQSRLLEFYPSLVPQI